MLPRRLTFRDLSRSLRRHPRAPAGALLSPTELPVQHPRTSHGAARRASWLPPRTAAGGGRCHRLQRRRARCGAAGDYQTSGSTSSAGGSCWHAVQTPISSTPRAGCTRSAGASRQRSQIAHQGRTGAVVPCGPLGRTPLEGRGQRLLEGWHRRMGTPARGSARTDRRVASGTPRARPITRSCALSSGWLPASPHALSSSPAQDLCHHPRPPSYHAPAPAGDLQTDGLRRGLRGQRAWPQGAGSGHARIPGRVPVWCPCLSTPDRSQRVIVPVRACFQSGSRPLYEPLTAQERSKPPQTPDAMRAPGPRHVCCLTGGDDHPKGHPYYHGMGKRGLAGGQ